MIPLNPAGNPDLLGLVLAQADIFSAIDDDGPEVDTVVLWRREVILAADGNGEARPMAACHANAPAHVHAEEFAIVCREAEGYVAACGLALSEGQMVDGPQAVLASELEAHSWALLALLGAPGSGLAVTGERLTPAAIPASPRCVLEEVRAA